ncbi:MAG: hypothetical protein RLW62_08720, partial [Gammaproteobacteria bacterium]
MARRCALSLLCLSVLHIDAAAAPAAALVAGEPDPRISAMKRDPRGPFARIRWFCNDGTVLPPAAGACAEHDGGHQHGEWSPATQALRAAGYRVATVYADLDIAALLAGDDAAEALAQMAVERFLLQVDDGWILRRARYYRGALQEEGERAGARRLLLALAATPRWRDAHYLLWRTLAALLPHDADGAS